MSVAIRDGGADAAPGAGRLLAAAARAASHADDRARDLLTDFFLPAAHRPSDLERAAMVRLFDQLVAGVESDLRAAIAPAFEEGWPAAAAALASMRIAIAVPILEQSGLMRDSGLVDYLRARAGSYRLLLALRRIAQPQLESTIIPQPPVADDEIVAADHALRVAEARRTDAAHEAAIDPRDLPADLFHRLVWRVAAALRSYLVGRHGVPVAVADRAAVTAGHALLAAHDEGETIDAAAARLALLLGDRRQADDEKLHDALRRGRVELFAALLGLRCGLEMAPALAIVRDPAIDRLAVLLKAAAVQRETATTILFEIAAINGLSEARLVACIDDFSVLEPAAAREAIEPWRLDEGYRAALAALAAGPEA